MNIIVTDLVKAANVTKLELETELSEFVEIHDLMDKYTSSSRQSSGTKKPVIRPSMSEAADKVALGCTKQSPPERTPLLATSSLYHLLQLPFESWKLGSSKNGTASQKNSQPSSGKTWVLSSKILSRVLHMCFHQLKFFSLMEKDEPFKTLIYGDIKLLGPPLLNIVFSLKSGPKSEMDLSKKEGRGQKDVECRKENIHLALLCLKKLIEISLSKSRYVGLIDHLVSTCQPEKSGVDDECKSAEGIDDRSMKSKMLLCKSIQPLLNEFLELCFYREAEVNALCFIYLNM